MFYFIFQSTSGRAGEGPTLYSSRYALVRATAIRKCSGPTSTSELLRERRRHGRISFVCFASCGYCQRNCLWPSNGHQDLNYSFTLISHEFCGTPVSISPKWDTMVFITLCCMLVRVAHVRVTQRDPRASITR